MMPIHDWTRVDAGLFHAFRLQWSCAITDALNSELLPSDYYALAEPWDPPAHDAIRYRGETRDSDDVVYSAIANCVMVRREPAERVSVIQIVSPGNKATHSEFAAFIRKSAEFLALGVHLLVIDLFPPGPRDPGG